MKITRKYHRKLSMIFAIPILIIVVTGTLLILRSKMGWIQTPAPKVDYVAIEKVKSIAEVIKSLSVEKKNISSIIYKPAKNLYAVRTKDYEEFFLHPETLEVLAKGPKISTLLIQIHEGSFFSKWVRDYIFFPTSLVLIFLWISGLILFFHPQLRPIFRKKNKLF